MKASWQEDYFKALIRLRLLLPVNPKTGTQKCDRCHIVARREPRGPLAYRAEMGRFCTHIWPHAKSRQGLPRRLVPLRLRSGTAASGARTQPLLALILTPAT